MADKDMGHYKEEILKKLNKAGTNGLSKSKLGIKDSKSMKAQALMELEDKQAIANMGSKTKTQYVLKRFYIPLDIAYEKIEKFLLSEQKPNKMKIISASKIKKHLPAGSIRNQADKAIELLVSEDKLIKVILGSGTYFLHRTPVLESLSFVQVSSEGGENIIDL